MASSAWDEETPQLQSSSRHNGKRKLLRRHLPPRTSMGQFSFGPTTQTTVVTTTTTTTTKFPPLIMPGPRHVADLDPRQYPLATSSTPASLRNIEFSLDGKPVVFKEADDAMVELEQREEHVDLLRRNNGTVRSVRRSGTRFSPYRDGPGSPSAQLIRDLTERPASPESISSPIPYSPEEVLPSVVSTRSRNGKVVTISASSNRNIKRHPRIREVQRTNPITPSSQQRPGRSSRGRFEKSLPPPPSTENPQHPLPTPITEQQTLIPDSRDSSPYSVHQPYVDDQEVVARRSSRTISRASHETIVPTPPVEPEDESVLEQGLSPRALSSIPTRLHMSQSPSVQDGTLPSPSLSPVTASASTQHNDYFADIDSASEFSSQFGNQRTVWADEGIEPLAGQAEYESPAITEADDTDAEWSDDDRRIAPSVSDIPSILNYFESLPEELKSYLMHQLLRRCNKTTLHVIADAVNPALMCDFVALLPIELALNVLGYLDVQSLCRAAQVSRKWRDIINSDEGNWKRLFDADGYALPEGELQQAINQGWGWQDPHGPDAREADMSRQNQNVTDNETTDSSQTPLSIKDRLLEIGTLRRSKRKATSQLTNRCKMMKRQTQQSKMSFSNSSTYVDVQVSAAEGPNNAANAAVLAVPDPELALPSLKGLHLFKSLYRRHHAIRKSWMSEETKPHHIAFRAHDSHVVTCLQFDTDKILTGSDDNNINVYDTRTGKLRKLLRGHEGGVWALQYIGNTLVSGSTDRSVRVWDVEKGIETQVFRGHTSTVRCLQILEPTKVGETVDGKAIMIPRQPLIITGSRDSTLRIWKLPKTTDATYYQAEADIDSDESPYFVRALTGHQHSVRAIAAHADTLVSGSYDGTVRVWKISTGDTVHRLSGHGSKVYSVVLDHKRNRCISGSMDFMVKVWSLETGSALYTLEGHSSLVGLLDLNNDRLVSAAADSTLRIWDPEDGHCKAILSAHTGAITCFQHDAQKVISGSDRTLKMWDIKKGECMKDLLSDLSGVWQVKFNERRCVAAVQRDNMTFIEVLDFGAARDGIPEHDRGRRIVVDENGEPLVDPAEDAVVVAQDPRT